MDGEDAPYRTDESAVQRRFLVMKSRRETHEGFFILTTGFRKEVDLFGEGHTTEEQPD